MAQVTPNPHEDDVDSTHSSNSADSDDDVNPPSVEGLTVLDDSTESPPQEQDTGTEREGTNNNESQVIHEVARSPNHALDEIKKQQTHNLYCPKCKSNITTDAVLFVKNQETDSYKTEPYVLWVPLVIPAIKFPTFDLSLSFLAGPWKKLKTLVANCLPSLNSPRLRFLLVAVLLLLSVIVLWSSHPPSPPPLPPPPSPSPVPVPPPPGPPSPSPSPEPPSPSPVPVPPPPGPPSPSPSPEPPSPSPIIHFLNSPLNQESNPVVEPPQPPVVIDEATRIRISVPNPKELWKYIVVQVQNLVPRELDILKSIVYGGLIESITSLGVVSSAIASGASTLNVISLGLASLSSGLFIIVHNLRGLISNQPRSQSTNSDHMTSVEVEDPYQTLLGNRGKFKLHCVVVVLSFFFFGAIPPLCYAFSFKISDKGHYKAAVVLAVSLVCVILLSFAKKLTPSEWEESRPWLNTPEWRLERLLFLSSPAKSLVISLKS
ncbi:unnamed protein product [Arabidopsis lyrata]|nr:unnamed protein product [Arabidopsis lyrata]